jgi:hypothetical protein
MIKELVKLANHLDNKGFAKEADYLDGIMGKFANQQSGHYTHLKKHDWDGQSRLGCSTSDTSDYCEMYRAKFGAFKTAYDNASKDPKKKRFWTHLKKLQNTSGGDFSMWFNKIFQDFWDDDDKAGITGKDVDSALRNAGISGEIAESLNFYNTEGESWWTKLFPDGTVETAWGSLCGDLAQSFNGADA